MASAVTGYHLRRLSVSAVLTLFMFAIGVLALIAFVYMGHKRLTESRFLDAAVFLLLCSLWSWTDSGLLQVYGSHVASWSMVSFFAFMLMSVPMLHFVANTVRPSLRRVLRVCALLFAANALAQGKASTDVPAKALRASPLKAKPVNKKIHAAQRAQHARHQAKRDAG